MCIYVVSLVYLSPIHSFKAPTHFKLFLLEGKPTAIQLNVRLNIDEDISPLGACDT